MRQRRRWQLQWIEAQWVEAAADERQFAVLRQLQMWKAAVE